MQGKTISGSLIMTEDPKGPEEKQVRLIPREQTATSDPHPQDPQALPRLIPWTWTDSNTK